VSPLVGTVNLCFAVFHPDGSSDKPNMVAVEPAIAKVVAGDNVLIPILLDD